METNPLERCANRLIELVQDRGVILLQDIAVLYQSKYGCSLPDVGRRDMEAAIDSLDGLAVVSFPRANDSLLKQVQVQALPSRTNSTQPAAPHKQFWSQAEKDVYNPLKNHIIDIMNKMKVFDPVDGFLVTFIPGDPPPLCRWVNRDDLTGGREGINFLLMQQAIVATAAELEGFCFDVYTLAQQLFRDRIMFEPSERWDLNDVFDFTGLTVAAIRSDKKINVDGTLQEAASLLLDPSLLKQKVSEYFSPPNNLQPTLFDLLNEKLMKHLHCKDAALSRECFMEAISRRTQRVTEATINTAERGKTHKKVREVGFATPEAFNRCSLLYYGARCIFAHGQAETTIRRTLSQVRFTSADFTAVREEDGPAFAANYFNTLRTRLEREQRDTKILYDDLMVYLQFSKSFAYVTNRVLMWLFCEKKQRPDSDGEFAGCPGEMFDDPDDQDY